VSRVLSARLGISATLYQPAPARGRAGRARLQGGGHAHRGVDKNLIPKRSVLFIKETVG